VLARFAPQDWDVVAIGVQARPRPDRFGGDDFLEVLHRRRVPTGRERRAEPIRQRTRILMQEAGQVLRADGSSGQERR